MAWSSVVAAVAALGAAALARFHAVEKDLSTKAKAAYVVAAAAVVAALVELAARIGG